MRAGGLDPAGDGFENGASLGRRGRVENGEDVILQGPGGRPFPVRGPEGAGRAGVRHDGHRIYATIEDRPGSIREVADIIRKHNFHLQSILTSYEGVKKGYRDVVIRTTEAGDFKGLKAELEETYRNVQIKKG